ncbi:MAG: hypothetical protein ACYTG1_12855 [Planctomycetota bacterium]
MAATAFSDETDRRILDTCETYLLASPHGAAAGAGRAAPAGLAAPRRLDPCRVETGSFVSLVNRLQSLALGPRGLEIPRWALYDCGEVPGGVFGLAAPAERVPAAARAMLGVEADDTGLVPLSMVAAIPMLEPGAWHTYALCAVEGGVAGASRADLRRLTLAAALATLGTRTAHAVLTRPAEDLPVHATLAPLEVLTAWTPAHTHAASLTCRFAFPPPAGDAAGDPPDRTLDAADPDALRALQAEIETGRRFEITGPPDGGGAVVPLREVTS